MTQQPQTPPGWFPQPDGRMRYWDGYRWTEQYSPGGPPVAGHGMPPAPRRSSNKGCLIAAIVVVVLALGGLATCSVMVKRAADEITTGERSVVYSVSGTDSGTDISYSEGTGGTSRVEDATLPWTKSFTTQGLSLLSLSATTSFNSGGEVSCKITVNGKVVKEASASGKGASAVCTHAG